MAKDRFFRTAKIFTPATNMFKETFCIAELTSLESDTQMQKRMSEEAAKLVCRRGCEKVAHHFFQQLGKHLFTGLEHDEIFSLCSLT